MSLSFLVIFQCVSWDLLLTEKALQCHVDQILISKLVKNTIENIFLETA